MKRLFRIQKDASIYNTTQDARGNTDMGTDKNAGLDEVLELFKRVEGDTVYTARTLVGIPSTTISASVASNSITQSIEYDLKMFFVDSFQVGREFTIELFQVSRSWDNGTGTTTVPTTDGVSWDNYATASSWTTAGGDILTSAASASLTYDYVSDSSYTDPVFDITDIVNPYVSGTADNNGVLLRLREDTTADANQVGLIQLFSRETNTVYAPYIEMSYNDYTYNTASLDSAISLTGSYENFYMYQKTLRPVYRLGDNPTIKVGIRPEYVNNLWNTGSAYTQVFYFSNSDTLQYRLIDTSTRRVIFDYDEYTKLSFINNEYQFTLDFTGFEANRRYELEFKLTRSNNEVQYFSGRQFQFKLER